MLYQDNYFVVSVKLNFCQRQTHFIHDQNKFQSVTDNDNEFTECQTPRKKLAPINWDFTNQLTRIYENFNKSNISEAYKVQVDCLKDSESDFYDKYDMKEKIHDVVRLHEASYSE